MTIIPPECDKISPKDPFEEDNLLNDSEEAIDEICDPQIEIIYQDIPCLTNALTKSKDKVRSLFKEVKDLKGVPPTLFPLVRSRKELQLKLKDLRKKIFFLKTTS